MSRRLIAAALVVLAIVTAPAAAHRMRWRDPDQTDAPEREMEIRSVTQAHSGQRFENTGIRSDLVSFDVRTYEDFDNERLDYWETEHWALMIALHLDEDGTFDRMVHVAADLDATGAHAPYGVISAGPERYDPEEDGRWVALKRFRGYARVERPRADVVRVSVPESALRRDGLGRFDWQVRTVWCDEEPPEDGCGAVSADYAPSERMHQGHAES